MKNLLKCFRNFIRKSKEVPIVEKIEEKPIRLITDRLDAANFYFGYDYRVNDKIVVHQPTIGEIIEYGESRYYSALHILTANPYDYMSELADAGIDFTKISDVEFFTFLSKGITSEFSKLIFSDSIDITKFSLFKRGEEVILFDTENDIVIDSEVHKKIVEAICTMHGFKKERFKPAGRMAKEAMIMVDRGEKKARNKEKKSSSLLPILSSAINYPGYKYNLKQTLDLNMFFFMDCIARIKLKDAVDGLTIGWYTGSLDTKKFKPENQLNWMKDLH